MASLIRDNEPRILFGAAVVTLGASLYGAAETKIWFMEAAPVLVALPLLAFRYGKFRLTPLLYRLLFVHAIVLLLGAHYTYAKVPVGFWFQKAFDLKRNHYDRLGHFFQGFVPAILAREILLRKEVVKRGVWLSVIVVSVCMAFSAYYEIIEWWTAASGADSSGDFMGSQGDVYDAQWDMLMAFIGSVTSLLFLGGLHDRQLDRLKKEKDSVKRRK